MTGGYMGKLLFVNLSTRQTEEEIPDESLYRDFIGCYGVGARVLYSRQQGGVDPLGPENTLGFVTGPLTGTPAITGCRFAVVAKSPLTGGFGDSSCGGDFGPILKFTGYDGVFISGVSPEPVYLLIDNGKVEFKDASHLWGKTTFETDEAIKAELSKDARVVSIGPAGEKQALVSCLMNYGGDAVGRSGLGAVAGSKKLKAIVARGDGKVPLADAEAVNRIREAHMAEAKPAMEGFRMTGTSGHADASIHSGDTPVKNWGGIGINEMPDVSGLHKDILNANVARRTACWHCPVACKGRLKAGTGEYKYPADAHRPEYETAAAFGGMCCNTNAESIIMVTHICNAYGLDTISTGTIVAFAMECYEHGIITKKDTDGIELNWGNHKAIVALTEKIAKREGIGDILADGVRKAAERIGKGAEEYAVHIGGQELGLHDPKFDFPFFRGKPTAARYQMDATPGRHTAGFGPSQFEDHTLSASGLCLHSDTLVPDPAKYITGYLTAVTGVDYNMEKVLECGERIATIRHLFTIREGINPLKLKVHGRIIGRPPFEDGPLAGVSLDIEAQAYWNLGALDWDRVTTKPSKQKLLKLGLNDVAEELWPPEPAPGPH